MQGAGTKQRYGWIDLAKALSILLVVLNHELIYFRGAGWSVGSPAAAGWTTATDFFAPVRMPLFFLASGFLASSSLGLERSEAFRKRIVRLGYLYAVWAGIFVVLIPAWPHLRLSGFSAGTLTFHALIGLSPAWYLWALPVAFYIGWVTRNRPGWLVIAAAGALAMVPIEHGYSGNLLRCLVYFIVGLRARGMVERVSARVEARHFVAGLIAFSAMTALGLGAWSLTKPLLELAGVSAAVMGCVLVSRISPGTVRTGQWLAKRTLPIYLMHFPLLSGLAIMAPRILPAGLTGDAAFTFAYPLLASALVLAAALALHALLKALGMGWLFDMPRFAAPRSAHRHADLEPSGLQDPIAEPTAKASA